MGKMDDGAKLEDASDAKRRKMGGERAFRFDEGELGEGGAALGWVLVVLVGGRYKVVR